MGGGIEHPGILYFYSESIALAANGCCALLAALSNLGAVDDKRGTTSVGWWYLLIGGVVQLLCEYTSYFPNLYLFSNTCKTHTISS